MKVCATAGNDLQPGIATNRETGEAHECSIRRLEPMDVDNLHNLHLGIIRTTAAGTLAPRSRQYLLSQITDAGAIFGAFVGHELIAYSAIRFASGITRNYGPIVGVPSRELSLVCHMNGSVVLPSYRGSGLHRKLSALRMQYALEQGFAHAISAVSTDNHRSLANHFANHCFIKGLDRDDFVHNFYVHRDLRIAETSPSGQPSISLPLDDLEQHRLALRAGLWGCVLHKSAAHLRIGYYPPGQGANADQADGRR